MLCTKFVRCISLVSILQSLGHAQFNEPSVKKRASHRLGLFRKRCNVCKNNSKSVHNSIRSDRAERIKSAFQTKSRTSICDPTATNSSLRFSKIIMSKHVNFLSNQCVFLVYLYIIFFSIKYFILK